MPIKIATFADKNVSVLDRDVNRFLSELDPSEILSISNNETVCQEVLWHTVHIVYSPRPQAMGMSMEKPT